MYQISIFNQSPEFVLPLAFLNHFFIILHAMVWTLLSLCDPSVGQASSLAQEAHVNFLMLFTNNF